MSMLKTFLKILIPVSIFFVAAQAATKVYRYKNNEGVTVMDNKIPAEYAGKGYEIVSTTGKVIKVVPPSLTKEEAEKQKAEMLAKEERLKADIELKRSYSSVTDIDAAKERNLQSLKANIAILRSTLESTKQEIIAETGRAASLERSGRKVTKETLSKIDGLQQKEKDITQQIVQRETELKVISDKFDQDKKRFIEITAPTSSASASSVQSL
jgi:chromosome segregation ATPase